MRKRISVEGARSRSAIVMNMNEEPQIAASAPSIRRWRRLTPPPNAPAAVGLPVYTEPPVPGRRSAHSPRARTDRRGTAAHPRVARARAEPLRAGGLLAALVGALRVQAFGPPAETTSVSRKTRAAGPR